MPVLVACALARTGARAQGFPLRVPRRDARRGTYNQARDEAIGDAPSFRRGKALEEARARRFADFRSLFGDAHLSFYALRDAANTADSLRLTSYVLRSRRRRGGTGELST